jgi:hypothetical protein
MKTAKLMEKQTQTAVSILNLQTIQLDTIVIAEREVPIANEKHVKADIHAANKVLNKLLALKEYREDQQVSSVSEVKTIVEI